MHLGDGKGEEGGGLYLLSPSYFVTCLFKTYTLLRKTISIESFDSPLFWFYRRHLDVVMCKRVTILDLCICWYLKKCCVYTLGCCLFT